ncbi:hypothetical protein [Skermanella aerolata]|uniref:hypothetical protein n=1 Tax=Skermanella aerolata TaxID=393310 RepID=UPI00164A04CD|nr:hypothetical protein [Skermanella aerolata]
MAVDDMAPQAEENAHRLDEMELVQECIIDLLEMNHERRSRLEGHVSRQWKAKALELG